MNSLKKLVAALVVLSFLSSAAAPSVLRAQQADWSREIELNGSVFFGNSSQRLAALRTALSRADSALEFAVGARFTYADVETAEGDRSVNRRSWDANTSLDLHPYSRVSPFIFGGIESSLEKQIDFRYGVGAGAKYVLARDSIFEHNFSLAALAEKTTPREVNPDFNSDLLMRWSARHRIKGKISGSVSYSSTTFYRPKVKDMGDFTISSVNSLSFSLNTSMSITFSFIDNYDSEARLRGAQSNNDGQLLFGLKTTW